MTGKTNALIGKSDVVKIDTSLQSFRLVRITGAFELVYPKNLIPNLESYSNLIFTIKYRYKKSDDVWYVTGRGHCIVNIDDMLYSQVIYSTQRWSYPSVILDGAQYSNKLTESTSNDTKIIGQQVTSATLDGVDEFELYGIKGIE